MGTIAIIETLPFKQWFNFKTKHLLISWSNEYINIISSRRKKIKMKVNITLYILYSNLYQHWLVD